MTYANLAPANAHAVRGGRTLSELKLAVSREAGRTARAAAIWTAVACWSRTLRGDGEPDPAVSEMLAARRRSLAGKPFRHIHDYHRLWAEADRLRRDWNAAGSPGITQAVVIIGQYIATLKDRPN